MAKTLGLGSLSDDDINRANHSLMQTLAKADPAAQTEIANALWVQKNFPINPDFRTVCQSFYDAERRETWISSAIRTAPRRKSTRGLINTPITEFRS